MATKTFTIDDIDGTEGAETIRFGYRDKSYEIDLGEVNTDKLERALAPFIGKAREVVRKQSAASGETALIREWAQQSGIEVNAKGRIPSEIVDRYRASQAA